MKKKLMLLGGIRYLIPVIKAAHDLGAHVITADYLPDNIAHKYSDEYVNVSIIDKEAVLKVAQEKKIDGIMSFGVDPGVVTAAYVAEKLGLPTPPLESVEILQNKDKFRDFLERNGFNCPFHKSYSLKDEALQDKYDFPVIVKPVDSAGSKGCVRVDELKDLPRAIDAALAESHAKRFIIERFLEKVGYSTDSDCFSVNDELVFCSFNCQFFDREASNPYAPAGFFWPSTIEEDQQRYLRSELQRLIRLLHLGTSVYNVEARVAADGKAYIMEVSPRGGGNRLSEMLKLATGQDLIENAVRFALGYNLAPMAEPSYRGIWAEVVVHSNRVGRFVSADVVDSKVAQQIVQRDMWVNPGDQISSFTGANQTIGTLVLKFEDENSAEMALSSVHSWLNVKVV